MMKKTLTRILSFLPFPLGLGALVWILLDHSEGKNALFGGLSAFRLVLAGLTLMLCLFSLLLYRKPAGSARYLSSSAVWIAAAGLLLFSALPSDDGRYRIPLLVSRGLPLLLWLLLSASAWLGALILSEKPLPRHFSLFLFCTLLIVYTGCAEYYNRSTWMVDLRGNLAFCLCLIAAVLLWTRLLENCADSKTEMLCGCLFFGLLAFCVTRSAGCWMGRVNTPAKAYWNDLAEAFLQGRMYLTNPSGTHDLTLYDGKWYVPNPPLPGLLLVPVVALLGSAEAVNMAMFSAVLAGINGALFYGLFRMLLTREDSPVQVRPDPASVPSLAGWLTVLFVFGTDHLWLGTTGQMWFISQLLVVGFTVLALILTLGKASPVLIGIALGLGVLSRPNIFPVYLCLLGLWLYQQDEFPKIPLGKMIVWGLKSGIPVVLAAALLLLYNKLRFQDWMDFGYVTINGADWILSAVQEYGMFHPHFLGTNASVMLWGLPELDFSGTRFFFQPHIAGYSIFLMTPPLVYLARSFHKNWAAIGAWAAVLLTTGMLLLYHNTGAEQVGYRYLLDMAAPLALLMADGLRGKAGWLYKSLTVFAVLLSFVALYWWYLGRV